MGVFLYTSIDKNSLQVYNGKGFSLSKERNAMPIGPYLKKLREESSFSQDSVAQKIGMSRPTYIQTEKGDRDMTIPEAAKLAEIFGMSLQDFLAEKSPQEVQIEGSKPHAKKEKQEYRMSVPQERVDKFKEVLLYVIREIGAKPNVGEAVLCKLLYFIDFDFYEKFEDQLIGARYIKNHFGPTPVEFVRIVKKMEDDGDLVKVATKFFDFDQKKYLPLRDPDLSVLKIDELEVINSVIARLGSKTAAEMREYSHGDVPWLTAEDGKTIDYESVFYRTPAYSVRSYADEVPSHAEFDRDIKQLLKKFKTLEDDLAVAQKNAIELFHEREVDNLSVFRLRGCGSESAQVYKLKKFSCKSLKGRGVQSGIRIVYAYMSEIGTVEFLEMYYKADQENEDRERIARYLAKLPHR